MLPHKKVQTIVNRFTVEKLGGAASGTFVGDEGQIFYDPTIGDLRISDDVTPGGIPLLKAIMFAPTQPAANGAANTAGPIYNNGTVMEQLGLLCIGDIKQGFQTVDHYGWYLLDGRNILTLPNGAMTNAQGLGWGTNLPNATNRILKKRGSVTATGGANQVTLTQANIPNYVLSGQTGDTGIVKEDHAGATLGLNGNWLRTGTADVNLGGQPDYSYHRHTVLLDSGGSDQPFSTENQYLSVNAFVYLGEE